MYVRVKRGKTTVFLHVDPTDTVAQLKARLEQLMQAVRRALPPPPLPLPGCRPAASTSSGGAAKRARP